MFTDAEKQRMELAKQTLDRNRSTGVRTNCIGTVLYVLGIIKEDIYVDDISTDHPVKKWYDGIVEKALSEMIRIENPEKGSVLVFRGSRWVEHMGIILSEEPALVYHRPGIDSFIYGRDPLERVISACGDCCRVELYRREL